MISDAELYDTEPWQYVDLDDIRHDAESYAARYESIPFRSVEHGIGFLWAVLISLDQTSDYYMRLFEYYGSRYVPRIGYASVDLLRPTRFDSDQNCTICLEQLNVGSQQYGYMRGCQCRALYHRGCIEQWYRVRGSCPLCRRR